MQAKKIFRIALASLLFAAGLPAGAQTKPGQAGPEKRPPTDQGGPEKKPPTQIKSEEGKMGKPEKRPPTDAYRMDKQGSPEPKPPTK